MPSPPRPTPPPAWRPAVQRLLLYPATRPLLHAACAAPALTLWAAALLDRLGPNPAEALILTTGRWTLQLLALTLAITPLRLGLGLPALAPLRRILGLWTFAYASLHLLAYAWLDMGLELRSLARDLAQRPFITVGMAAWTLLALLAATSPRAIARWLGGARWQALHRLVHLAAALALLHFFWKRSAKAQIAEVAVYALILGALWLWRLRRRASARAQPHSKPKSLE